jgi:hypothetical protein
MKHCKQQDGSEPPTKCVSTSGIILSIKLFVSVKGKAPNTRQVTGAKVNEVSAAFVVCSPRK